MKKNNVLSEIKKGCDNKLVLINNLTNLKTKQESIEVSCENDKVHFEIDQLKEDCCGMDYFTFSLSKEQALALAEKINSDFKN